MLGSSNAVDSTESNVLQTEIQRFGDIILGDFVDGSIHTVGRLKLLLRPMTMS